MSASGPSGPLVLFIEENYEISFQRNLKAGMSKTKRDGTKREW